MTGPEFAVVVLRLLQYAGGSVVFGAACFFLYALPRAGAPAVSGLRWARPLLLLGAAALLAGGALGAAAQTAVMAGSWEDGLKPESLGFVLTGMEIGRAAAVRAAAAALVLGAAIFLRGRAFYFASAALGAVACLTMAWMGHGAATGGAAGRLHLVTDMLHILAASLWIGALAPFLLFVLTSRSASPEAHRALHGALRGFSGIGSGIVAVLVASGLINSWFLVGPDGIPGLWTTPYGLLLLAKLALFAVMLALAASNRFRLTPGLNTALEAGVSPSVALARLRRSLLAETAAGVVILGLVAWLGTLEPITRP